jgi:outer membrane protein OmpA-like peptidoglycan-associated protein
MTRLLALLAVAVAGCSAMGPNEAPGLAQARSVYAATQADPQVVSLAQPELQAASTALDTAERLSREGAPPAEVLHQSYLAEQRSRLSQDRVQEEKYRAADAQAALARAKAAQEQQAIANRELSEEVRRLQAQVRELEARPTQRGWVLTVGSDLLFDSGRATLKPGGRRAIDNVARIMRNEPERNIVIEGFTDNRGSEDTNQRLSEQRAHAVRSALIQRGVAPSRIEARGMGEAFPVASNDNPAGRQLNRRVEIQIGEHVGRAATGASAPPRDSR